RAMRGDTTDAILRFYFPGLTVGAVPAAAVTARRAVASRDDVRSPSDVGHGMRAGVPADIALALPAGELHEREAVEAVVRRAREQVATAASVAAPPLRVTVHPNVESFSRATGQSWLAAGATRGHAIDLLPVTMLRRAGRFERVVTHE